MKAGKTLAIAFLLLSFFILPCPIRAYSGGSGDSNSPYQIASAADLLALAADTNNYDKHFVLTADIDLDPNLPGGQVFTNAVIAPDINNSNGYNFDGTVFAGVFDGNSHKISNLTIDTNGAGNDFLGLFGDSNNAEIKNLGLENVSITGGNGSCDIGGLAGHTVHGSISNCYSTGSVAGSVASGSAANEIGGLVGCNCSQISNCHSTCDVSGRYLLGGLIGSDSSNTSNCYATGNVTGLYHSYYLGGLVGYTHYPAISNSYATGTVSAGNNSHQIGGLVGWNHWGYINNCYSTGDVVSGSDSYQLGGLAGENGQDGWETITKCYSTGSVTGGTGSYDLGGFVGVNNGIIDNNCYFLDSSGPDNGLGEPLTNEQMKQQASFVGWDFFGEAANGTADIWWIIEDADYPKLNTLSTYSGGVGTADDPFQIANAADLLAMAANTRNYDKYFILTANIDLGSSGTFAAAVIAPDTNNAMGGFQGVDFTGHFDGNSHIISNLTIDTNGVGRVFLGLFGFVDGGQIKNLRLENIAVTGGNNSQYVGGLAGYTDIDSIISNCSSTGDVTGGANSSNLGGLVGYNYCSITNSCSTVSVSGHNFVGGLVGLNYGNSVSNCCSAGDVTGGDDSYDLGGLVGRNYDGNITNCYSTGNIDGSGSYQLGGLVGWNNSSISNCYSTGSITGGDNSIGGLVGDNYGSITNCYSTGNVNGNSEFGGLVGWNEGAVSSCYFLDTSGPDNNVPGAAPLTDKQMKQQASFVGWDFVDIWWIKEKVTYPKLTWQLNVTKCTVTAGKKADSDKISFSGDNMYATADDFNDANVVKVTILSTDIVSPCVQTFPIDGKTFKNGKYGYSKTVNGVKKSFSYDTKTHKFSFSVSNINLSGLDCPATVLIEVGDYSGSAQMDEAIVNAKMPVPIKLMTGVRNVLRVDKCTVKQGKKANTDQLSVTGGFTVANPYPNMASWITDDLVITLGAQTFTVPAANLKTGKGKFSCTKANAVPSGVVAATFDFNKCSFTLTIKNTEITATGDVIFGVKFTGFNETDNVTLP